MPIRPGSYVVLEVTDTGTGMDEETRSHLFEPFFTTKEKGRGTGLGLSTSYGIVKQNHGEILVRSELGEGSTFSIYLPRVDEPSSAEVGRSRENTLRQRRGNDPGCRGRGRRTAHRNANAREQGYTVLPANGGAEALQIAQSHTGPLQLLVSDVVMPRMSGPELANQIQGAASGHSGAIRFRIHRRRNRTRGGELEPDTDFLQKPFTREQLASKVREVLRPGHVAGEDMVS